MSTDWETPQDLFDALNDEFKFNLDVCATEENRKVLNYLDKDQDALAIPWAGSCWMNPPYNNQIYRWIQKAFNESQKGNAVVCLLQSRSSDTAAWHDCIMRSSEIRFIKGRLHFGLNGEFKRSNISNIIVIFKPYCKGPPIISTIGTNGKFLTKGEIMENEKGLTRAPDASGVVQIEQHRAIQEVQASMIIAKKFGRDQNESYLRIKKACERIGLASGAMYAYPRGGTTITGPSIRLAEVLAQNWGNLSFGIRELSQESTPGGGVSEVEAFAWDLETNTKQIKTFKVPHVRYSRAKGFVQLKDPREIYEMVANQGARRLRACILGIIPGDIVEAAVKQCEETIEAGDGQPFEDRVRDMLVAFDKLGVSKDMIEDRLGHKVKAIIPAEITPLQKIYNSLKDGMSDRADWFSLAEVDISDKSLELESKLTKPPKKKSVKKDIEEKSDLVKEKETADQHFRKKWIYLNKGFPAFVMAEFDQFKSASKAIQDEAKAKWLRFIERGIIGDAPWPLDALEDPEEKADDLDWSFYDVIKDHPDFINFRSAVENLGIEVYRKAVEQLGIEAPETAEDCKRVTMIMETLEDIQF